MKKIKIVLFLIFVIFFGLVIYQNLPFLVARHSLILDVQLMNFYSYHHEFPEFENGLYFLGCFFAGLILAYISLLKVLFKSRKTVKILNQTLSGKEKEIADLKNSLKKNETAILMEGPPKTSGENA